MRGQADAAESQPPVDDRAVTDAPGVRQTETSGTSRWWRLRNWRLSSKLIIVLLVPSLSTVALAGLRLSSQLDDARVFAGVRQELTLAAQVMTVTDALQTERDAVVSYVASGKSEQPPRFQQTDAAIERLRQTEATSDGVTGPVRDAIDKALASLTGLGALRNSSVSTLLPDTAAMTSYSEMINSLSQVNRVTATNVSNPQLSPLTSSLQALNDAKEQLSLQNTIVVSAAKHREFPPNQVNQLRAAQARFDAQRDEFNNATSADNRQLLLDTVSGASVDERNRVVQLALVQSDGGQPISVNPATVQQLGTATSGLFMKVVNNLENQADTAVGDLIDSARRSAFRDGLIVAVTLAIALALTVFVARSMLIPLRVLRRSALEMARTTLPAAIERILHDRDAEHAAVDPVPVNTTEEVGQVARAFDAVQREAVRLATEQAALRGNVNAMFVNLSRRTQALVERQIGVIDRLEQDEQDPDQLASLFELDHLATQMRRNSENLLVLAGTSLARRVTRPVPVAEVMGAAVSEVEKYARVQVAPGPDLTIQGRAVNDLTHLIAELLDNATAFSAPSTKVTVRTAKMRRGELAVEIHDRGVGMSEDELAAANERLANPPEVDVTASRQMGLFVVAQLAKRHDVKVRLRNNDDIDGGLTAHVIVPAGLIGGAAPVQPIPPSSISAPTENTQLDVPGLPKWTPGEPPRRQQAPAAPQPVQEPVPTEGMDLFAPRKKKEPSAEQPSPEPAAAAEPWPTPQRKFDYDDPPTERLPIYQEVLSQWFQTSEEEVPAGPATRPNRPAPPARPQPKEEPAEVTTVAEPEPEPEPVVAPAVAPEPAVVASNGTNGTNGNRSNGNAAAQGWNSPADEGWRAAQALLNQVPETSTTAGLPKRVPKAHLVPGSASTRPQQPSASRAPIMPRRSPDALRERLATYQRGVSLGRHSINEDNPGDDLDAGYPDSRKEQE